MVAVVVVLVLVVLALSVRMAPGLVLLVLTEWLEEVFG